MSTERNGIDCFEPEQLVVDQRDAALVERELNAIGIQPLPGSTNIELGLTPYTLGNLAGATAALRLAEPDLVATAKLDRPRTNAAKASDIPDLDVALFHLRRCFRKSYDGWTPLMGKDRELGAIHGLPYIKGGAGDPHPIGAPFGIPASGETPGPMVGMLDTRVFPLSCLDGRYLSAPIIDPDQKQLSTAGHATFVAGLILQRMPAAQLFAHAVLNDVGIATSSLAVAAKMLEFRRLGVSVLNLSFGCVTGDGEAPFVLKRAVERLSSSIVMVAAAGNHGEATHAADMGITPKSPMWPAAFGDVVAVGANDGNGGKAWFSPDLPWVDLMAPGVDVTSTFLPGWVAVAHVDRSGQVVATGEPINFGEGYASWCGTSFATANVTGEIAARMDACRIDARDALDQLLHPIGPAGDIRPHALQ